MDRKTNDKTYQNTYKCSLGGCKCCHMLVCKNNIRSTVNNRVFNTIFPKRVDCRSTDIIYVLT